MTSLSSKFSSKTLQNTSNTKNTPKNTKTNEPFINIQSIIIAYITVNLCSSLFNGINDCDESYNYWEPLHHFLFPNDESFKTWEYDEKFALRSWFYLFLHTIPVYVHSHIFKVSKPILFQFIRIGLAVITSISQANCFKSINSKFGPNISKLFFFFSCFSAGNFIASTALIPSSFCMVLSYAMLSLWTKNESINGAVYCIAFGSFVAWPFYGALGVPLALDIVFKRKKMGKFIYWCFEACLFILPGALLADFYFYGSLTFSAVNIVVYNIFSGKGPDLYGTEPVSYYFKNLFLNFNFTFIFAILGLPFTVFVEKFFERKFSATYKSAALSFSIYLSPLYIWLAIFFSQPHKEERFLFPVYPFICLSAAIFISSVQKLYKLLTDEVQVNLSLFGLGKIKFPSHNFIQKFIISLTTMFNFSRILASIFGFIGVLNLYSNSLQQLIVSLNSPEDPSNIESLKIKYSLCLGKEWHRFGTHFLIPTDYFSVKFIESEFKGQLPGKFIGPWPVSSGYDILSREEGEERRPIRQKFNDDNKEETDRYFNTSFCDFIIDKEGEFVAVTNLEKRFSSQRCGLEADFDSDSDSTSSSSTNKNTNKRGFKKIYSHSIINLEKSPWYSKSFYLPFIYEKYNVFDDYVILVAEDCEEGESS